MAHAHAHAAMRAPRANADTLGNTNSASDGASGVSGMSVPGARTSTAARTRATRLGAADATATRGGVETTTQQRADVITGGMQRTQGVASWQAMAVQDRCVRDAHRQDLPRRLWGAHGGNVRKRAAHVVDEIGVGFAAA